MSERTRVESIDEERKIQASPVQSPFNSIVNGKYSFPIVCVAFDLFVTGIDFCLTVEKE